MKKLPESIKSMLRVNQAGEYGAVRIYEAQLRFTKDPKARALLEEMLEQEKTHLKAFNTLLVKHDVHPTVFTPLWHLGATVMGAVTALMGDKAAHACTIAVEEVIEEHYEGQLRELQRQDDPASQDFRELFAACQADEVHHKHIAEEQGGREAPMFHPLTSVIKAASRLAIAVSKKI